MMPTEERLFIAVPLSDTQRQLIIPLRDELQHTLGGRAIPAANFHLTLAFLGMTPVTHIPRLLALLQRQAWIEQEMLLDRIGSFGRAPHGIVWLGSSLISTRLDEWVAECRGTLRSAGFTPDPRPFCLHLTLLRHSRMYQRKLTPPLSLSLAAPRLYASLSNSEGSYYLPLSP
ncbi:RNA 2',3'-cyclic phosphodiesterase [Chitinibacter sp. S2-10]|uniref:RNA 2',3'-cyclic phosphodiesterase n=1 Tax=Chitinibacter sp. S2-10 TaxID=3373597 RepID=UPI00397728A8